MYDLFKISLKFIPMVRNDNIPSLVQIMAWRRPGDKPLSEPMMDGLLPHICFTRPQWVKAIGRNIAVDWVRFSYIWNQLFDFRSVITQHCIQHINNKGTIRFTPQITRKDSIPRRHWRAMGSFFKFFDLRLNKRLSKQSWGWWFETPTLIMTSL